MSPLEAYTAYPFAIYEAYQVLEIQFVDLSPVDLPF
jgi:hypothetical protein